MATQQQSRTTTKYLPIYLNDHLAGSTGGLELVKRAAGSNKGTELGTFLEGLTEEIAEDRRALEEIMDLLDVSRDKPKVLMGWATEKLGRLKLNGELFSYSPLSRVVELEGLALGIEGKRRLWVLLLEMVPDRVGPERLRDLIARAERQRDGVERFRLEAAREAMLE